MSGGFSVQQLSAVYESIQVRPTNAFDVARVVEAEQELINSDFINQWSYEEHLAAIEDANWGHWIVERVGGLYFLGYIIANGLDSEKRKIYLKRIVITQRNLGYGRLALRAFQQIIFNQIDFQVVWLCVHPENDHAKYLYQTEGYVEIGLSPKEKHIMMSLDKTLKITL